MQELSRFQEAYLVFTVLTGFPDKRETVTVDARRCAIVMNDDWQNSNASAECEHVEVSKSDTQN